MNFSVVAQLLERLQSVTGNTSQRRISYCDIFNDFHRFEPNLDLESIIRLLFPTEDKRRKYSIGPKRLLSSLIQIFGWNGSLMEQRLRIWNNAIDIQTNLGSKIVGQGDFGQVVQLVYEFANIDGDSLSIHKVCALLHELAQTSVWSTIESSDNHHTSAIVILKSLLYNRRPKEAKWIVRIILKNMGPLHAEMENLMYAFHPIFPYIYKMLYRLTKVWMYFCK